MYQRKISFSTKKNSKSQKILSHLKGGRCLNIIKYDSELNTYECLIMMHIASRCDLKSNFEDWVICSISMLLQVCRLKNKKYVWKHIDNLISKGWLEKNDRYDKSGRQLYNSYRITNIYFNRFKNVSYINENYEIEEDGVEEISSQKENFRPKSRKKICLELDSKSSEERISNVTSYHNLQKHNKYNNNICEYREVSNYDDRPILEPHKICQNDIVIKNKEDDQIPIPRYVGSSRIVGLIFKTDWSIKGQTRWLPTKSALGFIDSMIHRYDKFATDYFSDLAKLGIRYPFTEKNKMEMEKSIFEKRNLISNASLLSDI